MDINIPEKCEGCGLCCINMADKKWVEVSDYDAQVIDRELLKEGDIKVFAMKQNEKGRCVCLDCNNRCSIYDNRPAICRIVQRGDDICIESIKRFNT